MRRSAIPSSSRTPSTWCLNGTPRDRLNYLTRKTHGFAKEVESWDALGIQALFELNWLRPHNALRLSLPAPQRGRRHD